jgi:uncharacterized protein YciI
VLSRMSRKELLVSQSQQSDIYFATILERGAHWDASCPMRDQEQWAEHLAFLDRLSDDGLLAGGGPLGEGEERFLLIVAAENQDAIETRLADDPWTRLGVWRIASIERWEVVLGARL